MRCRQQNRRDRITKAGVAQLVEQRIRNAKVGCSIHLTGTKTRRRDRPSQAAVRCFCRSIVSRLLRVLMSLEALEFAVTSAATVELEIEISRIASTSEQFRSCDDWL